MEVIAVAILVAGLVSLVRHRRKKRHPPAFDEGFGNAMTALKRAEGYNDGTR